MIVKQTPKLINTPQKVLFISRSRIWVVCQKPVRELFDLPKNVSAIQFVAHRKPGKHTVEITPGGYGTIHVDNRAYAFTWDVSQMIRGLLVKHGIIYVSCHYWE